MGERRDCACPRVRHEHGTPGAYNQDRCRCSRCLAAHAHYIKRWRHANHRAAAAGTPVGLTCGAGTRRRLQALAVNGWSTRHIAARLGVSQQRVSELRSWEGRTNRALAVRVAALYDELWDQHPTVPGSERVRQDARRRRWVSGLAWDDIDDPSEEPKGVHRARGLRDIDEVAVQRALSGDPAAATPAERGEAARYLASRGYSIAQIAQRLRCTERSVNRYKAAS